MRRLECLSIRPVSVNQITVGPEVNLLLIILGDFCPLFGEFFSLENNVVTSYVHKWL
jgi:hypothetical protein